MTIQKRLNLHKWILTAWLMLGGSLLSSTMASPQVAQPTVSGYRPTRSASPVFTVRQSDATVSSYGSGGGSAATFSTGSSNRTTSTLAVGGNYPTFHFHSTSAIKPSGQSATFTPLADNSNENSSSGPIIRKGIDPDEDEIGNIPVGEPLILLVLAIGYIAYKRRKQLWTLFC